MTGIKEGNNLECKKSIILGATLVEHVNEVGGGVKVAVVNDLWGNAIGLIQETNSYLILDNFNLFI
jgi:hypothetical protein